MFKKVGPVLMKQVDLLARGLLRNVPTTAEALARALRGEDHEDEVDDDDEQETAETLAE